MRLRGSGAVKVMRAIFEKQILECYRLRWRLMRACRTPRLNKGMLREGRLDACSLVPKTLMG
jgi:hypothetical protein